MYRKLAKLMLIMSDKVEGRCVYRCRSSLERTQWMNKRARTSLKDFQTVFEHLPIKEFQVIRENYNEIVIKIARGQGYSQKHTDFILKNIKDKGPANIRVDLVDSIPTESGKVKHLVSKIASPYPTSVE